MVGEVLKDLFHFRDQTHIWHLQADNLPVHNTLGDFYESLVDQIDRLAESIMAQGVALEAGDVQIPPFANYNIEVVRDSFKQYVQYLDILKEQFDATSTNVILDDMSELGMQTLYLLRFD